MHDQLGSKGPFDLERLRHRSRRIDAPSSANYDQKITAPIAVTASLFAAEQYSSCPLAMMGLSYNWTGMTAVVSQMAANGTTNQPIGLVWGWQSLAGGGPFTVPAEDPNYTSTRRSSSCCRTA